MSPFPSFRASVCNAATSRRLQWVTGVLPLPVVDPGAVGDWTGRFVPDVPGGGGGLDYEVVVGGPVGVRGRLAHVRMPLEAVSKVTGTIQLFPAARPAPVPDYEAKGEAIAAGFGFAVSGVAYQDPVLTVVRVARREGRFVLEGFLYVYADAAHVPFELWAVHSDPTTQELEASRAFLLEHAGVYVHVRWAKARGGQAPRWTGDRWRVELLGPGVFGDAQGFAWVGSFLQYADVEPHSPAAETLLAEMQAPAQLMVEGSSWGPLWGPFGVVPKLNPAEDRPERGHGEVAAAERHQGFLALAARPRGPWEPVPLGLNPHAGSTGDQQDFGASKLAPALAVRGGNPLHLEEALFSVIAEAQRPTHFREADGSKVRAAGHPLWVVWSGRTHYHPDVSKDRLGKPPWFPTFEDHGWSGKDNQHWSSLNLCGLYQLTGSHLLRSLIEDEVELYLAGQTVDPRLPTTGRDAPRAIGRTLLTACWLWLCTGRADLKQRILDRVRVSVAAAPAFQRPDWPVRTLERNGPDGRVLGGRWPFWVAWNEALAAPGLWAVHRLFGAEDGTARALAKMSAYTVVRYGFFRRSGETWWRIANGVRYLVDADEGKALPAEAYDDPTQVEDAGGGFLPWAYGAAKVALRIAQEDGDAEDVLERAGAIVGQIEASRQAERGFTRFDEWLAL